MSRLPRPRHIRLGLLVGFALLAAAPAGALDWSLYNSPLGGYRLDGPGAGDWFEAEACTDGRGGMWVAYRDYTGGGFNSAVRLKRLSADGTSDNALNVSSGTHLQDHIAVWPATDGGVYVAWRDGRNSATTGNDIYVQRIGPTGTVLWTAGGVRVTDAAGDQYGPVIGGGSALVVVWSDDRNGSANTDIYAARLNSSGVLATAAGGAAVITDASDQLELTGAGATGGVMFTWRDSRSGTQDIWAEYYTTSGFEDWAFSNGLPVCSAAGTQASPVIQPDGGSGAFVAWEDLRGADYDIYVQRIGESGGLDFGSQGLPVCDAIGHQLDPRISADGQAGFLVVWSDARATPTQIYAQRVAPTGAAQWTSNGVNVASATQSPGSDHRVIADGLGGGYVAWSDARAGADDLFGQRISSAGAIQWGSSGTTIAAAGGPQGNPSMVLGYENSLLVAFDDDRGGTIDQYVQRVDRYGYLGDASPRIVDVSDVPGDQGGRVRLDWLPGYVEFDPYLQVTTYYVLRQVPASLAASLQRAGAARLVSEPAEPAAGERVLLARPSALGVTYWEYVGQAPAFQADAYSFVAPTTSDSVAGVPASTQFMVQARNSSGSRYWFSNVKVGHSLDNLAPAAPAPFAGTYSGGASVLTWNPNPEADLAGYRLYRGSSASFTPSEASLVAALADTGHVDAAGAPYWYKLTAVDVHGNESPVATLLPSGTTDVEAGAGARAFLALGSANPVRSGGTTTLRFGLATAGRASLALYDAGGRRVRELATGTLEAGEHAITWDGRDEAGRAAAPGLYFARFEAAGFTATRKLVVRD